MPHPTRRLASVLPAILVAALLLLPSIAAAQEKGKCFLWKVQTKTTNLYLLGSVHVADTALYPLDAAIEKAFSESNRLVVEVNMLKIDRQRMGQLVFAKGMYGPGQTLEKNLSKETLKKLKEFLRRQGLSIDMVSRQRPWLVSMMVSMQEIKRLGYSEELGIDRYFLDKADKAKKQILQLETAENQIAALADISKELQDRLLLSTLNDYADARSFMESMLEAWKAGDVPKIDKLVRKTANEDPRLEPVMARLFDDRNEKMLAKIQKYLKTDGTYFVVVGAGHMVGKKGVVRLLRDKGYRVDQVAKLGARVPATAK